MSATSLIWLQAKAPRDVWRGLFAGEMGKIWDTQEKLRWYRSEIAWWLAEVLYFAYPSYTTCAAAVSIYSSKCDFRLASKYKLAWCMSTEYSTTLPPDICVRFRIRPGFSQILIIILCQKETMGKNNTFFSSLLVPALALLVRSRYSALAYLCVCGD
jgi:hypothetical protein